MLNNQKQTFYKIFFRFVISIIQKCTKCAILQIAKKVNFENIVSNLTF